MSAGTRPRCWVSGPRPAPKPLPFAQDERRAKAPVSDRKAFAAVRRAEAEYARQLRKVARHVGHIIAGVPVTDSARVPELQRALNKYAEAITPWATAVATRMIEDVSRRDKNAWAKYSADMSRALKVEIETAPTGRAFAELLTEQVRYIRSLPIEAGERVHQLTIEALLDGGRAREVAKEIARSGEVTISRANLIARTEVARTASGLVQVRAEYVGSDSYVWRTSKDSDVREQHRELEGKVIRWSNPPIAGPNGQRYHAGQGPNCRCYPEPIIPDFRAEAA
jgi:SPP1 gp7 family putative phage head morphogenesis protein